MFRRLLLLFILVPILELSLFLLLGKHIGPLPTIASIILTAILGAALTKSQGTQALFRFQQALASGKMPAKELVDGLLILVAGALLLTPGFLTDAVGFLFLAPASRSLIRPFLSHHFARKMHVSVGGNPLDPDFDPNAEDPESTSRATAGKVIDV